MSFLRDLLRLEPCLLVSPLWSFTYGSGLPLSRSNMKVLNNPLMIPICFTCVLHSTISKALWSLLHLHLTAASLTEVELNNAHLRNKGCLGRSGLQGGTMSKYYKDCFLLGPAGSCGLPSGLLPTHSDFAHPHLHWIILLAGVLLPSLQVPLSLLPHLPACCMLYLQRGTHLAFRSLKLHFYLHVYFCL